MRARLVVFPMRQRGRNWCFSRSIDNTPLHLCLHDHEEAAAAAPSTLRDLWRHLTSSSSSSSSNTKNVNNLELVIDFVSNKMNRAWIALEKAPQGTFKSKIHRLGLQLLSRVKPSEIFLKSISKDVTSLEITYPSSLNARLVRRRLRHIAMRGAIIHKKYFYGSMSLLPLTSAFTVLPLPNIPFFWVLFRTYSHWRALKGSEQLLKLVSDYSDKENPAVQNIKRSETESDETENKIHNSQISPWVLRPSKELEELLRLEYENNSLSERAISNICETFSLNTNDVIKFSHTM